MASSSIRTPRSVSDATRFTPTTPQAVAKATSAGSASSPASSSALSSSSTASSSVASRFGAPPGVANGSSRGSQPRPGPPPSRGPISETPEQRVARLRAAHLAARNAHVSTFDRIVDRARGAFDSLHRLTTAGLIGFTAVAGLLTVYAAVDMIAFNRKRKAEFIDAQKKMHADSLEVARLAYMRNEATPEQIALVDEANSRGEAGAGSIFKAMPSVIGAPAPIKSGSETATAATDDGSVEEGKAEKKASASWGEGVRGFFLGGMKSEDDVAGSGARAASTKASVADKARAAFDKERENQQKGGPLDQIGLEQRQPQQPSQNSSESATPPRKGWW